MHQQIVFFEMNYSFSTGAERIRVIEDLRKPGIFFPPGWDPRRTRQRESERSPGFDSSRLTRCIQSSPGFYSTGQMIVPQHWSSPRAL